MFQHGVKKDILDDHNRVVNKPTQEYRRLMIVGVLYPFAFYTILAGDN